MGTQTDACYADVVTQEFVTKTCPDEMAKLLKVLQDNDYDIERLAVAASRGDIQGDLEMDLNDDEVAALLILNTYDGLAMAFKDKTQGLELKINYHEKEDRGDEVDGEFWTVDNVYVLSEGGRNNIDNIKRKYWTVCG